MGHNLRKFGRGIGVASACLAALLLATASAPAQAPPPAEGAEDLQGRVKRLEEQNGQLLRMMQQLQQSGGLPRTAPEGTPEDALPAGKKDTRKNGEKKDGEKKDEKNKDGEKKDGEKKDEEKDSWLQVGKDLGVKGVWDNYLLWFQTSDGAFRTHIGGRTQVDGVWVDTTNRVQFGKGGIGAFDDAVNFRRARLQIDGWFYEIFDYYCEYDFVQTIDVDPLVPATTNNVTDIPSFTELWGGFNSIPWLGVLRIGNQKNPLGLEHMTSSRWLDFMERSASFDIYLNRNNGLEPGIQLLNWTENERMTWQMGVFKNNGTIQGWNVGNGDYSANARVTVLPWFQDGGNYMMHLGLGLQYDAPDHGIASLRERWLLRNGPPTLQNTVAIASIVGHNQVIAWPEFFLNLGPLTRVWHFPSPNEV